jgi:hypothetical protein
MSRGWALVSCGALLLLWPAASAAQTTVDPSSPPSRAWVVVGAGSVTVRGDCQTCEEDYPYRSGGTILGNVGYRVNERADISTLSRRSARGRRADSF